MSEEVFVKSPLTVALPISVVPVVVISALPVTVILSTLAVVEVDCRIPVTVESEITASPAELIVVLPVISEPAINASAALSIVKPPSTVALLTVILIFSSEARLEEPVVCAPTIFISLPRPLIYALSALYSRPSVISPDAVSTVKYLITEPISPPAVNEILFADTLILSSPLAAFVMFPPEVKTTFSNTLSAVDVPVSASYVL